MFVLVFDFLSAFSFLLPPSLSSPFFSAVISSLSIIMHISDNFAAVLL